MVQSAGPRLCSAPLRDVLRPGHDTQLYTGLSPFTVTRVPDRVCGQ